MAEDFMANLLSKVASEVSGVASGRVNDIVLSSLEDNKNLTKQDDIYSKLSGDTIRGLRDKNPNDVALNAQLAPYEHRGDFRDIIGDEKNPAKALAIAGGISAVIPIYQLGKLAARLTGSDTLKGIVQTAEGDTNPVSAPDLKQMLQGYIGVSEGLKQAATNLFK